MGSLLSCTQTIYISYLLHIYAGFYLNVAVLPTFFKKNLRFVRFYAFISFSFGSNC